MKSSGNIRLTAWAILVTPDLMRTYRLANKLTDSYPNEIGPGVYELSIRERRL